MGRFHLFVAASLLILLASNAHAGSILLDNSNSNNSCCVTVEVWQWGSMETKQICANPGSKTTLTTGLKSIGKIKAYRMPAGAHLFQLDPPPKPDNRYTPAGIYTPFSNFVILVSDKELVISKK